MFLETRVGIQRERKAFIFLIAVCLFVFAVYIKVLPVSNAGNHTNTLSQAKIWVDPNDHGFTEKVQIVQVSLAAILLVTFFILRTRSWAQPVQVSSSYLQHLFDSSQHCLRPPPQA